MKKINFVKNNYIMIRRYVLFAICILLCCLIKASVYPDSKLVLADPFILLDNGTYYAYGTHSNDGIEVYTSKDLKRWTLQPQLALHKNNTTEDHWFWAPEILKHGDTYYMYYSANEHMYVATSKSPLGPFRQVGNKPMLENRCIDSSPYIDDDGKAYLFFVYFDNGNNVYVAELNDDLLSIKRETMRHCLSISQKWESDSLFPYARVNEGPVVIKDRGIYYLTYSANDYRSKGYGIGYATATNVFGPWEKSVYNPILQYAFNMVGTGHHTFFKDKKGKTRVAFHAHYSKSQIHPRRTYFTTIKIKHGKMTMKSK